MSLYFIKLKKERWYHKYFKNPKEGQKIAEIQSTLNVYMDKNANLFLDRIFLKEGDISTVVDNQLVK